MNSSNNYNFPTIDHVMDYIPGVSTLNNGFCLISKVALSILSVVVAKDTYEGIIKRPSIQHIQKKEVLACLFMAIPGLNLLSACAHHHKDEDPTKKPWFISKFITRLDILSDFIPGVSLYNNVACLVSKLALLIFKAIAPNAYEWAKERSHVIRHLDNKHALVCWLMMVPIINIFIAAIYHSSDKEGKEKFNKTVGDIFTIMMVVHAFSFLLTGGRRY